MPHFHNLRIKWPVVTFGIVFALAVCTLLAAGLQPIRIPLHKAALSKPDMSVDSNEASSADADTDLSKAATTEIHFDSAEASLLHRFSVSTCGTAAVSDTYASTCDQTPGAATGDDSSPLLETRVAQNIDMGQITGADGGGSATPEPRPLILVLTGGLALIAALHHKPRLS